MMIDVQLVDMNAVRKGAAGIDYVDADTAGLVRDVADQKFEAALRKGEVVNGCARHGDCDQNQDTGDEQQQATHGSLEFRREVDVQARGGPGPRNRLRYINTQRHDRQAKPESHTY